MSLMIQTCFPIACASVAIDESGFDQRPSPAYGYSAACRVLGWEGGGQTAAVFFVL
jgi:hypothetical protein